MSRKELPSSQTSSNFDITGIELVPFPVTFKLDWNFRHPDGKEVKEKRFSNAAGAGTLSFDNLKMGTIVRIQFIYQLADLDNKLRKERRASQSPRSRPVVTWKT